MPLRSASIEAALANAMASRTPTAMISMFTEGEGIVEGKTYENRCSSKGKPQPAHCMALRTTLTGFGVATCRGRISVPTLGGLGESGWGRRR